MPEDKCRRKIGRLVVILGTAIIGVSLLGCNSAGWRYLTNGQPLDSSPSISTYDYNPNNTQDVNLTTPHPLFEPVPVPNYGSHPEHRGYNR